MTTPRLTPAAARNTINIRGLSAETREMIDLVRELSRDGKHTSEIAAIMGVSEIGVKNVLRLENRAYNPGSDEGLEHHPAVAAYIQGFKKF